MENITGMTESWDMLEESIKFHTFARSLSSRTIDMFV